MDTPTRTLRDLLAAQSAGHSATDRRKGRRYRCSIAASLRIGDHEQTCELTSLSNGGVSVRCDRPIEVGQKVEIAPHQKGAEGDLQAIAFQVQSTSKPSAGMLVRLALEEPLEEASWLFAELQELSARAQESRQRRGGVRVTCDFPATLSWDQVEQPVSVKDLGTTGARVALSQSVVPDRPLRLVLNAGETSVTALARLASVHDVESREFGLVFTGFEQGSAKEVMELMRRLFTPRRA